MNKPPLVVFEEWCERGRPDVRSNAELAVEQSTHRTPQEFTDGVPFDAFFTTISARGALLALAVFLIRVLDATHFKLVG
jgi:hypothetical protein